MSSFLGTPVFSGEEDMARNWVVVLAVGLMTSCGVGELEGEDGVEMDRSQLQTDLILKFVNSADATVGVLDVDVGIDGRAAKNIVAHVRGADGALGTADDNLIDSIDELDAISYVGTTAIAAIEKFAIAKYGTPTPTPTPTTSVTIEGVTFSPAEAAGVLDLLNDHWEFVCLVGLDNRIMMYLSQNKPFATIQAVAAVPYVGTATLTSLRRYVVTHPSGYGPPVAPDPVTPPPPGSCAAGTFEGVAFTQAEACKAVDFLNVARFSEMYLIPDSSRRTAYCSTSSLCSFRANKWATVGQYADTSGVGKTAITALKQSIANWTPNGLSYDTVATTWAGRAALQGKSVFLDKVIVTKKLGPWSDGTYDWNCVEVRDTAAAPNYLTACYRMFYADDAPACSAGDCLQNKVGSWFSMYGVLKTTSKPGTGGYLLSLVIRELEPANPAVP
jgi:hypothetical protein